MVNAPVMAEQANDVLRLCRGFMAANDWRSIVGRASGLPRPVTRDWAEVADVVAFALGQTHAYTAAIALLVEVWSVAPGPRCASSLAFLHYSALHEAAAPRRRGSVDVSPDQREQLKRGFRRWIGEALRLSPGSVKDLYRLGIFEAQLEARHDKVALRAFLEAIRSYRELDEPTREKRHDLRKYVARSL